MTQKTPSYLGFDFSTQQIKCVGTDGDLSVLFCHHVSFDEDLPQYETSNGIHQVGDVATAPVGMWIEAVDLLFERMTKEHSIDFSKVRALSGCGQMHGTIYWSAEGVTELSAALKGGDRCLLDQLGNKCFVRTDCPVWVDSTTAEQCAEMEASVGGGQAMCHITGSRATERFGGPQIRKIIKRTPQVYEDSDRISIVSSFACSLFLGSVANIDVGEGSGTNLMDLRTSSWDSRCIKACISPREDDDLSPKLGPPVQSYEVLGNVATFWVERYGFCSDCKVVPFTGDNCASVEGLRARTGDLAVSCGTSDNLIFVTNDISPPGFGYLFRSPMKDPLCCFNLCYKNGSLLREWLRDELCGGSWARFEQLLSYRPVGNEGFVGLFYQKAEHIPVRAQGIYLFNKNGEQIEDLEPATKIRALVEGQFLMKRAHLERLSGYARIKASPRILITGGASSSPGLCQILADVYNGCVYLTDIPNAAALGNAFRAKFALSPDQPYDSIFPSPQSLKLLTKPNPEAFNVYSTMLPTFNAIEKKLFGDLV